MTQPAGGSNRRRAVCSGDERRAHGRQRRRNERGGQSDVRAVGLGPGTGRESVGRDGRLAATGSVYGDSGTLFARGDLLALQDSQGAGADSPLIGGYHVLFDNGTYVSRHVSGDGGTRVRLPTEAGEFSRTDGRRVYLWRAVAAKLASYAGPEQRMPALDTARHLHVRAAATTRAPSWTRPRRSRERIPSLSWTPRTSCGRC